MTDGTILTYSPEEFEQKKNAMRLRDRLLDETKEAGRICPKPELWNRMWELLPDRK